MNNIPMQEISQHVLQEKYAQGNETTISDIQRRVAEALASVEPKEQEKWASSFLKAMQNGFVPGGRIMASAGVDTGATLINCFVQPVYDSMHTENRIEPGIMDAVVQSAETMRRGGGVGYDFSKLRPNGSRVRSTNSRASGPISYMRVFNEMCATVESAGARRGAQMAILRCDHPDILEFIACKDKAGEMTNFNISIAVTDAFIEMVQKNETWKLVHQAEPSEEQKRAGAYRLEDRDSQPLWCYRSLPARNLWDTIIRSTYDHAEPGVFFIDRVNHENNLSYCEELEATNPCGEQPLPPYGCCDLGSINLTELVHRPFTTEASFCFVTMEDVVVPAAVRMLDNVLDLTHWPLKEQKKEAIEKRRIGLGILGLGDALLMLGLPYDSPEGRSMAARIMKSIRDQAYETSIQLAAEKKSFPKLDIRKHRQSPFIQRLPKGLQDSIDEYGIRNSHLLSIAPTGTISLAFADNASNGIEPPYSWTYVRTKRMKDGSRKKFEVENHAHRMLQSRKMPEDRRSEITDNWKTALEIAPKDHVEMMAALQPFVDSAISKTVNIPEDFPFVAFQDLYMTAWRKNLKGLTTYRPNKVTGAVLSTTPSKPADDTQKSPRHDRRISLKTVPQPALASLRWQRRPMPAAGNAAWTYVVNHPRGKFAIFIGEIDTETEGTVPFEVWVNGEEQPRGLGALAKSLSMDMRSADRGWLYMKLENLMSVTGDDDFSTPMPPGGSFQRMPSLVSGFANLIYLRCCALKIFETKNKNRPMLDALMKPSELVTGPDGTISWTVDVENPNTSDDIVLGLKELTLPDGTQRPYSLWLSGVYPRVLDGLCHSLSLDMQIIDPAWIGAKLRQIRDFREPLGDFMAREPGTNRMRTYPSTVAYIARLLIHRHAMLGILDEDGMPVEAMGAMHVAEIPSSDRLSDKLRSVGAAEVVPGKRCRECGSYTVIQRDGCRFCTSCGHIGDCG